MGNYVYNFKSIMFFIEDRKDLAYLQFIIPLRLIEF